MYRMVSTMVSMSLLPKESKKTYLPVPKVSVKALSHSSVENSVVGRCRGLPAERLINPLAASSSGSSRKRRPMLSSVCC